MEIRGTVMSVETDLGNGYDKKVVMLQVEEKQAVFIQFYGNNQRLVTPGLEKKDVAIKVRFNGKVSGSGAKFNNIIVTSLKLV